MSTRKVIKQFTLDQRSAVILNTTKGYEVDLFENDNFIETRKIYKHSKYYANDLANNWVAKIIE